MISIWFWIDSAVNRSVDFCVKWKLVLGNKVVPPSNYERVVKVSRICISYRDRVSKLDHATPKTLGLLLSFISSA
jgi:hypothetical protein